MNSFYELSRQEKLRHYRGLAEQALTAYELEVAEFDLAATETNIIYRVTATDGRQFALRLANDGWRSLADAQSEILWLQALARDTDIPVPRITLSRSGEPVVVPRLEGVPPEFHAILMDWKPGTLLGNHLTEENLEKMGTLFARLHSHGCNWQPPATFNSQRFDHFISRGEREVFLDDGFVDAYDQETLSLLQLMREKVATEYANLATRELQVIHCDLWHDNIKVHQGLLYPIDFEDTIWGFRLHDIAMSMLDLYEVTDRERYLALLAAFRQGYEAHLSWPVGDMTLMQIGRILWRINYNTRFDLAWRKKDAEFNAALFKRYLETGELIPPLRLPR